MLYQRKMKAKAKLMMRTTVHPLARKSRVGSGLHSALRLSASTLHLPSVLVLRLPSASRLRLVLHRYLFYLFRENLLLSMSLLTTRKTIAFLSLSRNLGSKSRLLRHLLRRAAVVLST